MARSGRWLRYQSSNARYSLYGRMRTRCGATVHRTANLKASETHRWQSKAHRHLTLSLRTRDITFFKLRRATGFCSIALATNRASHEHRARITFSVRRARSPVCSAEVTVHWLDGRLRRIHFPCHLEMNGGCTCLELRQRPRRFAHR
jgi:hypothetical protein